MSEDSLNSYGSDSYGTDSESDDGTQELSSWQRLKQRINNKSTIQAPTTNFGGTGTFTMEHLEQQQSNSPRVREGRLSYDQAYMISRTHSHDRTIPRRTI